MINATPVAGSRPVAAFADLPDRRSFLAQAGGALLLATTAQAALSASDDPIFAAIEAHRSAAFAFKEAIDANYDLECELPRNKRNSSVTAWEEKIVQSDDPRWIVSERAIRKTSDAESGAACALINVMPTTIAGVIALLQYAVSADPDGQAWPDDLVADEFAKRSRPWYHFLIANLAEVLPGMVSA